MKSRQRNTLFVVLVLQAMTIAYLVAEVKAKQTLIDLYTENRQLVERYKDSRMEACLIKLRLADAYRITLAQMMKQLGLMEDPNSAASMVLTAYYDLPFPEESVAEAVPPNEGGVGGP